MDGYGDLDIEQLPDYSFMSVNVVFAIVELFNDNQ